MRSPFKLKDKWALCPEEACFQLTVELAVPLETILLQCDVPIELLEADSNVAIVSRTPPAPGATGLLATYRCQEVRRTTPCCCGGLQARRSQGRGV